MVGFNLKKMIIGGYILLILAFLLFLAATFFCVALDPTSLHCHNLSCVGLSMGLICLSLGLILLILGNRADI